MDKILFIIIAVFSVGCATLTEDAMTPIALSFGDGSEGECQLSNKRGAWATEIPATLSVRKSDDPLKFQCETNDGRSAVGSIDSEMGAKIIASAVFLDFGITDAITDKHRQYAGSFVIPVKKRKEKLITSKASGQKKFDDLEQLNSLRERGVITDEEFESEKKKLLESN